LGQRRARIAPEGANNDGLNIIPFRVYGGVRFCQVGRKYLIQMGGDVWVCEGEFSEVNGETRGWAGVFCNGGEDDEGMVGKVCGDDCCAVGIVTSVESI
jgi:hypothetical protein